MISLRVVRTSLLALSVACLASLAWAAPPGKTMPHAAHGDAHGVGHGDTHGAQHGSTQHGSTGHGDAHGGHDEHGVGEVNWMGGLLGESKDVEEPTLLWRPVGMPPPVGAQLINSAILFFILFSAARKPVVEGLKKRKQSILQGFAEAAQMKETATARLAEYEQKLAAIDEEIARVRTQMQQAAEQERTRVLQEAKERCERMERDAKILIEQELKAAREQLIAETAKRALVSAQQLISSQLTSTDKDRLLQEYVATLGKSVGGGGVINVNARGGLA
jgi:F-type H+-transporting ATPase subunit b